MKAIILNLLAWVMLPIMDGFAKYLSYELPVLQITWARYFFTVLFTFPLMFLGFVKSFDPNFKSMTLEDFAPMVKRIFSRKPYSLL